MCVSILVCIYRQTCMHVYDAIQNKSHVSVTLSSQQNIRMLKPLKQKYIEFASKLYIFYYVFFIICRLVLVPIECKCYANRSCVI